MGARPRRPLKPARGAFARVESLETGKREKGNGPHERISNFFFSPSLSLSLSISHHGITIHSFKTVFFAGRQFLNSPSPFSLSSIRSRSSLRLISLRPRYPPFLAELRGVLLCSASSSSASGHYNPVQYIQRTYGCTATASQPDPRLPAIPSSSSRKEGVSDTDPERDPWTTPPSSHLLPPPTSLRDHQLAQLRAASIASKLSIPPSFAGRPDQLSFSGSSLSL
jgi:hypothetical protein